MRRAAPWIAWAVAAPWVAWAIGRTLGLDRVWPLTAVVAFTPYAALTAPVPVLVALALRRWWTALVALVAAVALAAVLVPRVVGEDTTGSPAITVMTSNLYFGKADPRELLGLVRRHRVDVLTLLEVSPQSIDRLRAAGLDEELPHRFSEARPGGNGAAVLSRHPLTPEPASLGRVHASPAAAVALPDGPELRVQAVHPPPPLTRARTREWRSVLRGLPAPPTPSRSGILAGDFNATLDHHELRRVLDRGYRDAAEVHGRGLRPTWPVRRPMLGITIDHVLFSGGLGVDDVSVHEVAGADHRAVIARLVVEPR